MKKVQTAIYGSAILLASLAGCSGQGNYTREGVSMAKERMSFLKSATEWELARQAFLAGDLEKAIEKVDYSLSINDSVVKSHVLKGRILIEFGDLGNALKSLQTATILDPEEPDAHYYLGVLYERLNRPEDAHTHFEIACDVDDYNPSYAVAASEMLIDLDRLEEAKAYLVSIPMAANNAGIRQSLGHIALIESEYDLAVKYFKESRLLAPDDEGIAEDLIHALMMAGEYSQAEHNIALMMKKIENADRTDLKVLHAKALMNTGRPVEARSIYQELLSDAEGMSNVDLWIGLANASFVVDDMRNVRKAASRIVALAPDLHDGYLLYAMYHRQTEDFSSALASIDKAIEMNPINGDVHAYRSLILSKLNRRLDAIASASRAVELDPGNPMFSSMLEDLSSGIASVPTGN